MLEEELNASGCQGGLAATLGVKPASSSNGISAGGAKLKLEDVFSAFDFEPVASASLAQVPFPMCLFCFTIFCSAIFCFAIFCFAIFGSSKSTPLKFGSNSQQPKTTSQVHRAVEKSSGRQVAVKVQHEGLREGSRGDCLAITFLVAVLHRCFNSFDYVWLTREMNRNLPQELDFNVEAANLTRCAEMLGCWEENADVTAPQVRHRSDLPLSSLSLLLNASR